MIKHRNSQKRVYFEDAVYFVTSYTLNRHPYFKESIFCDVFMENLGVCKKLKSFNLYGWVLLHNHFHLLIKPSDEFNISKIIQFLKRHVSRDINDILLPSESGISESRFQGGNNEKCDQLINDHRKKIELFQLRYLQKYQNQKYQNQLKIPKFCWHESFHDHFIRNDLDFDEHWEYIAWNPVKHKMLDGWPYVFTNPEYEDLIDECI